MKRLLGLVGACSLVFAASAPAQISSYSGTAGPGTTVAFSANVIHKKGKCKHRNRRGRCVRRARGKTVVTEVEPGLKFSHLPLACDDGAHTITLTKTSATPVSGGAFSSSGGASLGGIVSVSGHFSSNGSSATGTVRDTGTIGGHTGCDTGTLSWSASR